MVAYATTDNACAIYAVTLLLCSINSCDGMFHRICPQLRSGYRLIESWLVAGDRGHHRPSHRVSISWMRVGKVERIVLHPRHGLPESVADVT